MLLDSKNFLWYKKQHRQNYNALKVFLLKLKLNFWFFPCESGWWTWCTESLGNALLFVDSSLLLTDTMYRHEELWDAIETVSRALNYLVSISIIKKNYRLHFWLHRVWLSGVSDTAEFFAQRLEIRRVCISNYFFPTILIYAKICDYKWYFAHVL